jgi:hypothetical protein
MSDSSNPLFRASIRAAIGLAKLTKSRWKRALFRIGLAIVFLFAEELVRTYVVQPIETMFASMYPVSRATFAVAIIIALIITIADKAKPK